VPAPIKFDDTDTSKLPETKVASLCSYLLFVDSYLGKNLLWK